MKYNIGDIVRVRGDIERVGIVIDGDLKYDTNMFKVQFFHEIFFPAWFNGDMLRKVS
jgi:hypothetical protein